MQEKCLCIPENLCPYHGVTLALPPYVELVKQATLLFKEREATVNLVQVNNMNPEVLLKDINEREIIILTQVDSTVEGLRYLQSLIQQNQNDKFILNMLNNRKQVALILLKKREELTLRVENYKIENFKQTKKRRERINLLISYLNVQLQLLKFEQTVHEKRGSTPRNILANSTLIKEIEESISRLHLLQRR